MLQKNYVNYHCHSMYSNVSTPDSTITNKQRVERAKELGMTVASGAEHGWTGRFIEVFELANSNGLKPLFGTEVYYVKNRFEKDRTNSHIILLARNELGRKSINKILSEANLTGYYYKPRIDQELLLTLKPENVWITTACLGGIWKYEDSEEIVKTWKAHFGDSLFLEVQYHHTDEQRDLNRKILKLSKMLNIKIIAGMDSHMISQSQSKERDDYLLSRGIEYPDEQGWFLDFPSYDEAYQRFITQGVLSPDKISEALDNTNTFESVETYTSTIFNNTNIKLPSILPDKTQNEKNDILWGIIQSEWNIEKENVPQSLHAHYEREIQKEFDVVKETGMADYFILDYNIVRRGKELGGSITMTGRGSAPSFYMTKLLGLTTIDRISATVKLFPERFISKERLLETKSLPDIDLNLGTPKIFAEAQRQIIGDGHSYPMIAFGTVKTLGAWKLYARVAGIDFETSNKISEKLQEYEFAMKHAGEDDEIDIYKYVGNEFRETFDESTKYVGLVNTLTPHPCAYLLFSDGDIAEEFGLVKIKTGNVEHICANIDGLWAEKYKFLKNDLLKVSVVDLIYKVYARIGIEPHPLPKLLELCDGDEDVWGIYEKALGMGINQVEQSGTIGRVAKYKPKNISELSAFVAAIRPGFKSNYKQFEAREPFSYGVKTIDELIQTKEFPQSYLLYQENAMQIMSYAGIPIYETYDVIKNIAKKRIDKVLGYKSIFINNMKSTLINKERMDEEKAVSVANDTWQIIEDSSRYSFNASHSYSVAGDSLYGAYLKAKYPLEFYEVFLEMLEEDGDKDRLAKAKEEAEHGFGIKFPNYEFGQDNRRIVANHNNKSISSSMKSLKGFNHEISEHLYELGQSEYASFVDFLIVAEEKGYLSSKFEKLIAINYFKKFGKNNKLMAIWTEFKEGKNRYSKKLTEKSKIKRIAELFKIERELPDTEIPYSKQIEFDLEIIGKISATYPKCNKNLCTVIDVNDGEGKFAPRVELRSIKNGKIVSAKIQRKVFSRNQIHVGDNILVSGFTKKPTVKYIDGLYVEQDGEFTRWLDSYEIIDNVDKFLKG